MVGIRSRNKRSEILKSVLKFYPEMPQKYIIKIYLRNLYLGSNTEDTFRNGRAYMTMIIYEVEK